MKVICKPASHFAVANYYVSVTYHSHNSTESFNKEIFTRNSSVALQNCIKTDEILAVGSETFST